MKKRNHRRHFSFNHKSAQKCQHISADNAPLTKIDFSYQQLPAGKKIQLAPYQGVTAIILLAGTVDIMCARHNHRLGPRKTVFRHKAHAFTVPAKKAVTVIAPVYAEISIIKVPFYMPQVKKPQYYTPQQISVKHVGKGTFERSVHNICTLRSRQGTIIIGETFNKPGKWSSFPPHKHARNNGSHENLFEEVYLFKVDPCDGFGMMRLYQKAEETDGALCIKHNDIAVVTEGYHPVCALPGCNLYYLWVLVGRQRAVKMQCDPVFLKGH